jgi:hypothetical protein
MPTVVISPHNVVNHPEVGGHFWVYMQYAHGLHRVGCDVYWLERFDPTGNLRRDRCIIAKLEARLARYGLGGKLVLYRPDDEEGEPCGRYRYLGTAGHRAEALFRHADLLLNFNYRIDPRLLARFRRTALVDIDPGLFQFWLSTGQLTVAPHDVYFTIGETVGTPRALFPDCGLPWTHIRPPVSLDLWPYVRDSGRAPFTTVSTWWGDEWITDGRDLYENNKRVSFLQFASLPWMTSQPLELAAFFGEGDAEDCRILEANGWRIRHSLEVARTPEMYRSYLQRSRGEFSCAKPSCMKFQNAWVSDRTICYLAGGKPAVIQNTGPSSFLPDGLGLVRFSSLEQARDALETVNADYETHRRAARGIAEAYFDAVRTSEAILNVALVSSRDQGPVRGVAP